MDYEAKVQYYIKKYPDKISVAGVSHNDVKLASSLNSNKKVAGFENLFITEGLWAFEKLIYFGIKTKYMFFCPEFIKTTEDEAVLEKMIRHAEKTYVVSIKACKKISEREGTEGFFCICKFRSYIADDISLDNNNIVVILDGLEQPGNIGSIIRSADAAGADGIIVCNRRVRLTHSRLIRASLGGIFSVPTFEMDINDAIQWLKKNKFKIFLTDLNASAAFYEPDYNGRIAIVAGNEYSGVSKTWYEHDCTSIIIPMFGSCESLNVGFATTMTLYQASLKQKGMI